MTSPGPIKLHKINDIWINFEENTTNFVVSRVTADGLANLRARTSAGAVMIMLGPILCIFTGSALKGSWLFCTKTTHWATFQPLLSTSTKMKGSWFWYNRRWSTITLNSLRPRQNGRQFPDDIFKCIFLIENVIIPIKDSMKFVPKGSINNISTLVQIMAWRRPGDKPLSEPMMVRLSTHICVTRPHWVLNMPVHAHSRRTVPSVQRPKDIFIVPFSVVFILISSWQLSCQYKLSMQQCPYPPVTMILYYKKNRCPEDIAGCSAFNGNTGVMRAQFSVMRCAEDIWIPILLIKIKMS